GGAEPTVADLALYGQLNQVRRDPTGRTIVGDPARPHGRWLGDVERRADGTPAESTHGELPDADALAPLARRLAGTYLRFAVASAGGLGGGPKGRLVVELADGVPFQAARAGYNRKCLAALLGEIEEAVGTVGRLVGGAADEPVFAELRHLGGLLAPYPQLAAK